MAIYGEQHDRSTLAALRTHTPSRVRWTLLDLVAVAVSTVAIGALVLIALRALLLGTTVAAQIPDLALNLGVGGLIYVVALLMTSIWIVRRGRGSWREIGFRGTSPWWLLLVFGLFIVQYLALVIASALTQLVVGTFENPQIAALTDPAGFSWINFTVVFTVGAIIAPIVEEVLFRGLLYQWLRKHTSVIVAVLLSAAIFSVAHVVPVLFPALFVVGIVLALAFEWSQSLWVAIALHMLQNGLVIIALFAIQALGIPLPQ